MLRKEYKRDNDMVSHRIYGRGSITTPLRMSYEESCAKAFPFDKMANGMLDS
jgi:hypothetical protein